MEGDIYKEVEALAQRLGLPADFYTNLVKEDDWSFVIKANALVEAACSDALSARLHEPLLASCLATLELGHPKHGKVALLRTLGAINKEQAAVLQLLYELRNILAHNIGQINFRFESHLQQEAVRNRFVKVVSHGIQPSIKGTPSEVVIAQAPKLTLWLTLAEVLACLHLEHDLAESRLVSKAFEALAKIRGPSLLG